MSITPPAAVVGELSFEIQVDPEDSRLQAFDCGSDDSARAINAFFRTAAWIKFPGCIPLRFELHGAVVGFGAVRVTMENYPEPESPAKAPYLTVYAIGVNKDFRGKKTADGRSHGDCAFEVVEWYADQQEVLGLQLLVRPSNASAIALYERHGLFRLPGDPWRDHRGVEFVTMRKDVSDPGRLVCQADG